MKLQHDDDEYSGLSVRMPVIILGASLSIFFILALVLATNNSKKKPHAYTAPAPVEDTSAQAQEGEAVDTLRADDLNFWDMYQYGDQPEVIDQIGTDNTSRKDELEQRESDMRKAEEEAAEAAAKAAAENADPATDGKHTMVTHIDGTTEWLPINSSLKLNTYEDTQFQSQNGIMGYYVNGRRVTKTGVDISQYTTSIDWTALSRQADYVMIRVGARGYDTGNIIADTKFIENVTQAAKAGIPFGVYFSSQAINETEAKEEATYVMTQLAAAQSAIASLGLSTAQTNNNTSTATNTGTTANQNTGTNTTANTTTATVSQILQQKLKGMGLETDPTKYGTTTSVKDTAGNTTTTVVDSKGNTTVTVNDADGKQISKKTVNLDPYGNVTTVTTDADGTEHVVTEKVSEAAVVADPNAANTTSTTATTVVTTNPQFKLAYPVAIEMHLITNDISRIEGIDKTARTSVLTAFCNMIETGGYNAMVAAGKEFLLCQVNLAPLSKYEIWMANEGNLPDYPYLMSMWKYNTRGKLITGLSGDYGVSVGFIDYAAR